jgi:hypothetical protein
MAGIAYLAGSARWMPDATIVADLDTGQSLHWLNNRPTTKAE